MFGDLPKSFGQGFLSAFFLPAAIFALMTAIVLNESQIIQINISSITASVLAGFVVLFISILLVNLNRSLFMIFEGYYPKWWFDLVRNRELARYRKLITAIAKSDEQYLEFQEKHPDLPIPESILSDQRELKLQIAEQFPPEEFLLPTAFGNVIRAFETYFSRHFGLDNITGWERLIAVIPKDYIEFIDSAKTKVDFWVNIRFLSLLFIVEYVAVILYAGLRPNGNWDFRLLPLIIFVVAFLFVFCGICAKSAAIEWGDWVKASVELFLPDLFKKIQPTWEARKQNKEFWKNYSKFIFYGSDDETNEDNDSSTG